MSRRVFLFALIAVVAVLFVDQGSTQSGPIIDCIRNQTWSLCGRICEPSCAAPEPNTLLCPRIECTEFLAACRCDKGYVRNEKDRCVLPKDC